MKTFLTIQDANKEIKRLRQRLCCCPNNCPLSERTYYGDLMNLSDLIQIQISLNSNMIYSLGGVTLEEAITTLNGALLGLAVFTYDGTKLKMVTSICATFELIATIDNG